MGTDLTVANTILEQLGGNRFLAMTGARNLAGDATSLSFRLPGNGFAKNGINYVKVTLEPSDTYTVVFKKIGRAPGFKVTEFDKVEDVYCDNLREVFERATGLATSLGTMRGAS